ncbi:MAG TPA: hypothetical protein VNV65_02480 [Candidatus Solibacter sp.]|jgi:hypothetical protein|nr:hypothetical protein [Candidatus Solibacter sp.]
MQGPDQAPTAAERKRVIRNAVGIGLAIVLLAALIATQTFPSSHSVVVDARAAGLVVAAVAVTLRAPFLVVVAAAAVTAALIRHLG